MAKKLIGKAPLTLVRTTAGQVVYVYRGRPAPGGIAADERKRLLGEGYLAEVDVVDEEQATPAKSDKVEDILAEVGDDQDKAAAALEVEKAGKNRSTLISKLEAIASTTS